MRFRQFVLLITWLFMASGVDAAAVIVNEYNAVGSESFLDNDDYAGSEKEDPFFATFPGMPNGRIQGNGGNWIELAVVEDNVDVRDWELRWAEHGSVTGTRDIWLGEEPADELSDYIDQGVIRFSNAEVWSDLPAGTIITVSEQQLIGVWTELIQGSRNLTKEGETDDNYNVPIDLSTDTSLVPESGDWWIHVSTLDELDSAEPLVTAETNVTGDSPGNFSVGNNDWQVTIVDASDAVVFGPIGEGVGALAGGGISSDEVGKLEEDASSTLDAESAQYNDGTSSTFGAPNIWSGGEFTQRFGPLRGEVPALQAGDTDQNLQFDQQDLVLVQIAGKYMTGQPATWGEGDWDGAPGGGPGSPPQGNGEFDQQDIVAALQADIYLSGPYAGIGRLALPVGSMAAISGASDSGSMAPVEVPEPTPLVLLVFGMLGWWISGARSRR